MSLEDDWIFQTSTEEGFRELSRDRWVRIATHVLGRLEEFLGCPITYSMPVADSVVEGGFSIGLQSPVNSPGAIQVTWLGIAGATILGDHERMHVEATIFVYVNKKKVVTSQGGSFLYLEYQPAEGSHGRWSLRWLNDEYGEYEEYDDDDDRN